MANAVRLLEAIPRAPVYLRPLLLAILASMAHSCRPMILAVETETLSVDVAPSILLTETTSGAQLEPQFLVSDLDQLAEGGVLRLLRDADSACAGGRVVDFAYVSSSEDTKSVLARYTGFTELAHSYRALFTSESGVQLCSNAVTRASDGIESAFTDVVSGGAMGYCALKSDQTVKCWGDGTYGGMGDNTLIGKATPVTATGLANVKSISGYTYGSCAVVGATDAVYCWGYNGFNSIGDGTATQRNLPTANGLTGVTKVVGGQGHNCALIGASVKCWGKNDKGQLGDGSTTQRPSPVDVMDGGFPIAGVLDITAGLNFTCARMTGDTVKCWGENNANQMADGTVINRLNPVVIAGINGVVELGSTPYSSNAICAKRTDARVWCWGTTIAAPTDMGIDAQSFWVSSNGRLYVSPPGGGFKWAAISAAPAFADVGIEAPSKFATLGAGACGLMAGGYIRCWGEDTYNGHQRGDRDGETLRQAALLPIADVVQVSGLGLMCGRHSDGSVSCWNEPNKAPVAKVPGIIGATHVSAGYYHACALLADKSIRCWGSNASGQLGNNSTTTSWTPVDPGLANVIDVSAGNDHTCAVLTGGTTRCWGNNGNGQLGNGTLVASLIPVPSGAVGVASLALGYSRSCARLTNGGVSCWGQSMGGWLGTGAAGNYPNPVVIIAGGSGITKLVSGTMSNVALSSGGTVYYWGRIGMSSMGWPFANTRWFGGVAATDVFSGQWNGCAKLANNTVQCWGNPTRGLRGNASTELATDWVTLDAHETATELSASSVGFATSGLSSCQVSAEGRVSCIGGFGGSEIAYGVNYALPVNATYVMQR